MIKMERDEILRALEGRKTLDELRAELNANRKELKKELKSMRDSGIVETDGNHYWKGKAGQKKADQLNYAAVIIVIGCILLGFYLRSYHMDYPVIGYHNWKETHYLSEARNFVRDGFFKYGVFVPAWDYPSPDSDPSGVHSDTLPTISILVSIAFMLFGYELWVARLVGILMNTGTILLVYLIVKKIFEREDIAVVSAFLMAINPMLVFFSHNVQLINVGIFCALLSLYLFLLWKDSNRGSHLILTAIFLALAGLTKYPFLAITAPMFFLFPFRRLKEIGKNLVPYLISAIILLSIPAWIYYSSVVIIDQYNTTASANLGAIQPDKLLTDQFWKTTESYVADSFTLLGAGFAVLGLIMAVLSYLADRKFTTARRFMLGSLVGTILFAIVVSSKLMGHAYYYYVIAPFVVIFMAYFMVTMADFTRRLKVEGKGIGNASLIVVIILAAILVPGSQESASRQFNTQFHGLDVAGEYIKEHKSPGERVMHSSHQAFGILWHADMKGTRGIPPTLEKIKFAEDNLNATWLFIYNWDFDILQDEERWPYIRDNYRLVQIGFMQTNQGSQPFYFLLRKGGTFDENELNDMLAGKTIRSRDYELTSGIARMSYINLEE